MIKILEYSFSTYSAIFSGTMENVDVFSDRGSDILGDNFHESPLRYGKYSVYIKTAAELLKIILANNPGKKINILEVGGGTGKLTGNLLAELVDKNIEYHFTDIGKSFITDAKLLAERLNLDFMKFDKFDVSQEPQKQGFELSKYDIVLAYDVIHAAENIEEAVKNLEMVTAPGGIMIIIEAVHPRRWANMAWGMQTGWWYFNDFRSNNMSPLITLDEWDQTMGKFDMSFCETYPIEEPRRSNTAFGLIVAQKECASKQSIIDIHNLNNMLRDEFKIDQLNEEIYNYDISCIPTLTDELQNIKENHGQVDSIYLCLNNSKNIPIVLRDYEHHKEEAEYHINEINYYIKSIKESGILKGKLNIIFEKSNSRIHADELIISEYTNAIASMSEFDITSIYLDEKYLEDTNKTQITDAASKISSIQMYFSPGILVNKKGKQNKRAVHGHNIYSRPNLNNSYVKPQNETEKILTDIWKVMFGIEQIGIEDNFIELGGDSLMATKIISRMKLELDVLIKIPVFFQNPTIKALAEIIISTRNMINELTSDLEISNGAREEGEI